ncbi:FAD-dependent oxidoreductase [Microbacterium pygmaeum]|uniref:2-polyprenyl-6-methoxyphenol hydroxylase n=1 Tax=Microbacterium pygmaeum TaxID=370764 RepID=A0A1G7V796_9MICO|nr:NAD(P)/FAD-dependent oxidoreductase [Microbacterium pygmaeum]SDG54820.1 2-polyprenyl-6-methoxyphenol hydroxylase [Microbacterium pygmaeum]
MAERSTHSPDVVVIGAGPVGLLLASQLSRSGVDVEVLERRPSNGSGSRAIGVHAPVLAALEPSGLTERLLASATRVPRGEARSGGRLLGVVHFDRLSMRFPFVATLPQAETERMLAAGAPQPLRGATVSAIIPRADGVHVRAGIGGRPTERTIPIVVVASGAGGRDLVFRKDAIGGHEYRDRYLMTDLALEPRPDADTAIVNLDRNGVLESFPMPGGVRRFVAWDRPGADPDPAARVIRLRAALATRGEEVASERVSEATAFGVRRFIAPRMRNGRVLVIGDAAHEVSPIGGQGMNLGLLDAAGLAPLLVEWVRTGQAPDRALHAWEQRRVRSATIAARLAALNTGLGRPLGAAANATRGVALRAMLAGPIGRLFASAYAMGLDRGA